MTAATSVCTTASIDVTSPLWEVLTLVRSLQDLAAPVLDEHDAQDSLRNVSSPASRFDALVDMIEGRLSGVLQEIDAARLAIKASERAAGVAIA